MRFDASDYVHVTTVWLSIAGRTIYFFIPWHKDILLQGTDIPVLDTPPLLQAHLHLRGVLLRPACVTLCIERNTITSQGRVANKQ